MRTALMRFAIVCAAIAAPPAAMAQDGGPACDPGAQERARLAAELAEGSWSVRHNAGYVVAQGMVMPHPAAGSVETGSFDLRDGRLVLVPKGSPMTVEFDWVTDQSWNFDSAPTLPDGARLGPGVDALPDLAITDDDLSLLTNCPSDDLPRLTGQGSVTMDGTTLDFTLRLVVVGPATIYGFQQVDAVARGIPMLERRSFVMQRD